VLSVVLLLVFFNEDISTVHNMAGSLQWCKCGLNLVTVKFILPYYIIIIKRVGLAIQLFSNMSGGSGMLGNVYTV